MKDSNTRINTDYDPNSFTYLSRDASAPSFGQAFSDVSAVHPKRIRVLVPESASLV